MEYPNTVFIESRQGTIAIGNRYIVRVFSVDEKRHLRTEFVRNRRIEGGLDLEFQPCSEEFVIRVKMKRKKPAALKSSALQVEDICTRSKENCKVLEIRFAPYRVLGVTYTVTETIEATEDKPFLYKTLSLSASDDRVLIDTIDTEFISLPRGIQQKWSRPNMKKAYLTPFQSALGQPVYLNGLYTGSEFPANDNNIEDGIAHIRYYAGKSMHDLKNGKPAYTTWKTVFGAARSLEPEVIRADFLSYIRSISRPISLRTQYNSWFDHMLDIDKDNIRSSFFEIEKGMTQNGLPPVDAYVVDDGWPDYDKDFWCFNQKFPNELYESAALAKNFASDFGLWLGPRGGYNKKTPRFARRMQRAKKGGYNRRSHDICTADHRYTENVKALFLDYMDRFDINYWKLDGFMLRSCPSHRHGHPTGGYEDMYCFTDHWERWFAVFQEMHRHREAQGKSLWINQTSYCNASPWHLQFSESLWMQNSDDIGFIDKTTNGEAMQGKDFDRMLTYRDTKYFDFHETRAYQFPLSNLYNHEPIYGNTAKIQMTDEEFRKYLYMLATRGTAFWELYYSCNMMNDVKWQINADVLRFLEDNFHILRNAKLIGHSPNTGAVYGYSAWEGAEGFVSLRNPMPYAQTFSFTLDRRIGVAEGTQDMVCTSVLPHVQTEQGKPWNYGDTYEIELNPHEIRVLHFGAPVTAPPVLLRAKAMDEHTVLLTFDRHIFPGEFACAGEKAEAELLADYSEVRLHSAQPFPYGESFSVQYAVRDVYGNLAEGTEKCICYKDHLLPEFVTGVDEFTVRLRLNNAPEDGILYTQGDSLVLSVSNGKIVADCGSVRARSDEKVSHNRFARADIVRERNGVLKIYVNGALSGAGYRAESPLPAVSAGEIRKNAAIESCTLYDRAFAYDELR